MAALSELQRNYWSNSLNGAGAPILTSNQDLEYNFYKTFSGVSTGSVSDLKRAFLLKALGLSSSTLSNRDLEVQLFGTNDKPTQYAAGNQIRTNWCAQPSIEIAMTALPWGNVGAGPSRTKDSSIAQFGSNSQKVTSTVASTQGALYRMPGAVPGNIFTASCYVRSTVDSVNANWRFENDALTNLSGTQVFSTGHTPGTQWTRWSVTTTAAPAGTTQFEVQSSIISSVIGNFLNIDGLLIELGSTLGAYFDGSMANCFWEDTPHNSRSFKVL